MDTTPAMDLALSQDRAHIFLCGQIDLPGYTLRMLETSGQVTWSQGTFTGEDARFGSLSSIEAINDGIGDQAPQLSVSFSPPNSTSVAELASPNMQGSRIRIWLGAIDLSARTVIPEPYLLFDGELDQPVLTVGKGTRELDYECVSSFEKFFRLDEGMRLSDTNQQEFWPGETGLSSVTGIVKQIIWGPGDLVNGGYSGAYGDGGGFGGGSAQFEVQRNEYV